VFDINILGLNDLSEFFERCNENEEKLLRKATVAGGRIILRAAKANCKKFKHPTGNLEKSLRLKVLRPKEKGKQAILIGPEVGLKAKYDGYYGRMVEKGHRIVGKGQALTTKAAKAEFGGSKTEPEEFLRPAYDENAEKAYAKIAEVYNDGIGEAIIEDIEDLGDILTD